MRRLIAGLLYIVHVIALGFILGFAIGRPAKAEEQPAIPCLAAGGDCIDWLNEAGRTAYCTWASGIATAGSYYRSEKLTWDQTRSRIKPMSLQRPMTDRETKHVLAWLKWGYDVGASFNPYLTKGLAYNFCMERSVNG